jgi:LL-diaminopimelate aminotransferase
MQGRFGVTINPDTETTALIGSKEGLANVARAFINPGDHVLVPNPAYPVYANGGTLLNDGIPISMPLLKQNLYLPPMKLINDSNAKMIFLNFPNNPTGAIANTSFLKEIVSLSLEKNLILCYDNAYSEITFGDYKAPSILEIEGAMEVAIEFHSFSKTFNMTGDRIAFAVGNEKLIEGLVKVKSQIDSGPSKYIQLVAIRGLQEYRGQDPPDYIKQVNATYQRRGKVLIEALRSAGLKCVMPKGTFYIWAECGGDSMAFTRKLIERGVIATPGIGFGKYGEGYIRFSLTRSLEVIERACTKIVEL